MIDGLDLVSEYLRNSQLAETVDSQFKMTVRNIICCLCHSKVLWCFVSFIYQSTGTLNDRLKIFSCGQKAKFLTAVWRCTAFGTLIILDLNCF